MEQHLCVDCMAIPLEIKTSFRLIVRERLCAHMRKLFNIDIVWLYYSSDLVVFYALFWVISNKFTIYNIVVVVSKHQNQYIAILLVALSNKYILQYLIFYQYQYIYWQYCNTYCNIIWPQYIVLQPWARPCAININTLYNRMSKWDVHAIMYDYIYIM